MLSSDKIISLLSKEYLVRKNELKEELGEYDWWTIGGYELGFLYPLLTYYDKLKS